MGVTHGRVLMWNKIPSQKSVELLCNLLPPSLVIASTLNHNPLFNRSCNFTQVPLLNYPLHSQLGTAPLKRDLCSIRKDQTFISKRKFKKQLKIHRHLDTLILNWIYMLISFLRAVQSSKGILHSNKYFSSDWQKYWQIIHGRSNDMLQPLLFQWLSSPCQCPQNAGVNIQELFQRIHHKTAKKLTANHHPWKR